MKINEVSQVSDARIFSRRHLSREINTIYVSDLMGNILTYGREAQLLVTELTTFQVTGKHFAAGLKG